ncbi:hypothetical protein [Baekduia sp. Peel2402]|uniref:hypothetical protein n=1 Tax=Baekduia sp. Peel2402 TaxID=3458296 RepID=UPI00403EBC3C
MPGAGLQHVSLETRRTDAEAEARFWTLLGFTRVAPPASLGESRAWWFQAPDGATQIHLLFEDDPVAPPAGHVAVVVDGWIATLTALTAAGFTIEERTPHWNAPRAPMSAHRAGTASS